jgi:probable phosphoglycerate mutase
VVIRAPGGEVAAELKKYIGRGTNNVAEYYALIAALDYAAAHGIRALRVRSDSELLVRQMQGRYKVKSSDLRPLFERAKKMSQAIPSFTIEHVRREQNSRADSLANQALDSTASSSGSANTLIAASRSQVNAQRPSDASTPAAKSPANSVRGTPQHIRARYSQGVLVLAEPLDLPEGSEVEIQISTAKKS